MESDQTSSFLSTERYQEEEEDSMNRVMWVILLLLFIIIGLANIIGNVCTLVAFFTDSKLQQVTNYYICNLAIADLLVGLSSIPVYAVYTLSNYYWGMGKAYCKVWLVMDYLLCAESSLTIILISLDRLLMVQLGPGSYQKHVTPNRTIGVLGVSWICAFVIYGPAIIGTDIWRGYSTVAPGDCDVEFSDIFHYVVVACVLEFCVPLILVCIFNSLLYVNIRHRTKWLNSLSAHAEATSNSKTDDVETLRKMRSLRKDKKAARTLFILVVAFLVCWSPYSLTTIFNSVCGESCVNFHMYELFTWLLWINSSLNPYLYAYSNIRIRKHFKRYLFPCGPPQPVFKRHVYAVSKQHANLGAPESRGLESTSFARI
jgi:histamine receptor H3